MKPIWRRLVFLLVPITLVTTFDLLRAGETTVRYRFDEPLIERSGGFSRLVFPATMQAGKVGEPSFPFRGVQILLPPGETISEVRIERRGWTLVGGKHKLYPRQHVVTGVDIDQGHGMLLYNSAAYEVDRWIHPPVSRFSTHYLKGHAIAVGSFSPAGFRPARGDVGYYKEVEVTVETTKGASSIEALYLLRTDGRTNERISMLVDNPLELSRYDVMRPNLESSEEEYDYLIITRDSLVGQFKSLRDFYTRRGMLAEIVTVEGILAGYSGNDPAEKVRNAIIDEYTTHGITHVLLGGDGDGPPEDPKIVPYRGMYCAVQSLSFYEDDNIPADIYFAALDGNWNDDGDTLWGEPGEEDFYSEIAIGRASVDTQDETGNFINKTIMYQDSPVPGQVRSALMLGEKLYNNPLTYGGDELDQLIGTCTAYGFTTTGIPEDYDITKYYDRDLGSWNKSVVIDAVNAGTNWLSHEGHANISYVMRLLVIDITDIIFVNDGIDAGFPIMYSHGCYCGSFDNRASGYGPDDCIGEEMVSIAHCAAAFLGNSRYGWFTEGTTNGPSHHFQREFVDAIFTEGYNTLGAANQRSKDETVPFIDLPEEYETGAHRWCFYTLNLIGDPALDGWTDTPESLLVSHPSEIGRSDTLVEIEAGIEGAVAVLYSNGFCYGRDTANSLGSIELVLSTPLPDTIDTIELDVYAHNHYVYRDTITIVDSTGSGEFVPAVTLEQNAPNPFNPFTVIRFSLESDGLVDLRVYDVSGREVDLLIHRDLEVGHHTYRWRPHHLASGVYFYVLRTHGATITRKAVLLR